MTSRMQALSAYRPTRGDVSGNGNFAEPLRHYIVETTVLEARKVRVRQTGLVAALLVGVLAVQWPAAVGTANAIAGVALQTPAAQSQPLTGGRLAFASRFAEL